MTRLLEITHRTCCEPFHAGTTSVWYHHAEGNVHLLFGFNASFGLVIWKWFGLIIFTSCCAPLAGHQFGRCQEAAAG